MKKLRNNDDSFADNKLFTLIELLIVIAVIAILASLLLPALNKARAKSQQIGCAGNLRQLGVAFAEYGNDFNGYFPESRGSHDLESWDAHLFPYIGIDSAVCKSRRLTTPFACPGDPEGPYVFKDGSFIGNRRSYGFNYYLSLKRMTDVVKVHSPTQVLLLSTRGSIDPSTGYNVWERRLGRPYVENLNASFSDYIFDNNNFNNATDAGEVLRHQRGTNFLYTDGHVAYSNNARLQALGTHRYMPNVYYWLHPDGDAPW